MFCTMNVKAVCDWFMPLLCHSFDEGFMTALLFSLSVCKKDQCSASRPSCPAHKKLSIKQTDCCDSFECVCSCQNSTRVCPPGYVTKEAANDCGCVEVTCLPDKVGVKIQGF